MDETWCAPELEERLRPRLEPANKSWRVEQTGFRVKGKMDYLCRAADSTGATIDFPLSAQRASRRLCAQLGIPPGQ